MPNEIEKISMFGRRIVGPFARRSINRAGQPDRKAASGLAGHIAHHPVAARTPSVRQIGPAEAVRICGERSRNISDRVDDEDLLEV
ncbi:hypothetical protein U0C82_17355 [Fulvimarina sp. 2208YS6-2-32]|uniref:Uncharacterized protein n=1 Tax=Fulvimarina uroteuthidis TaxID=3098149 RepID=A0ABU5I689_9HYPH|nr:hypothetical protein [Fulvimarina sp. 2208YS6-2-32]MDY8110908.1 hypothetical protein [Fulvimarina sp. 2208YS6-2-32]